jgi:methionine-rich copper-binding protein CopC
LRLLAPGLAVAAIVLAAAGLAPGHSLLLEASPAPGASLAAPPARIVLRFNNRVEKKLSSLRLVDPRGGIRVLTPSAGGGPAELVAPAPGLEPGAWRLEWQAFSADGHVVSGSYGFRIGPGPAGAAGSR